jgi:hypothetical protein
MRSTDPMQGSYCTPGCHGLAPILITDAVVIMLITIVGRSPCSRVPHHCNKKVASQQAFYPVPICNYDHYKEEIFEQVVIFLPY